MRDSGLVLGREGQRRESSQGNSIPKPTRDSTEKLGIGKRLTAELWAATGNHCIDVECMAILARQRENQKESEKTRKEDDSKTKIISEVRAVILN
jgi:hypothetical protein